MVSARRALSRRSIKLGGHTWHNRSGRTDRSRWTGAASGIGAASAAICFGVERSGCPVPSITMFGLSTIPARSTDSSATTAHARPR
jgi:hypothetical protein